jgi:hypothetical protein
MKGLLFTYLMTYGGAAAALFSPFTGFLVYVSFAILKPQYLWPWSVPEGNNSRIVAIALLAGWARAGFGSWDLGRGGAVARALLGFFGWTVFGAIYGPDRSLAFGYVEELAKIVVPVLVAISLLDSTEKLKRLAWVILMSQGYLALEFNLSYLQGFNVIKEVGFARMDNNTLAITLVPCAGLGLFLGLGARAWYAKGAALVLTLLIVHAVLLSFSRGGCSRC